MPDETREALRELLPEAVARLGKLLFSEDERVALAAVQVVFARVLGKESSREIPLEGQTASALGTKAAEAIVEAAKRSGLADH